MIQHRFLAAGGGFALLLSSCGVHAAHYRRIESYIVEGRPADAADYLERNKTKAYADRDRLVYYLDRAMVTHLAGDFRGSNEALESAAKAIEALYTKSVSRQAGSILINDTLKEYPGEDFESVMVHNLSALNYVFLGEWDDALVEARRVDLRLKAIAEKAGNKVAYREDAFARYLMGLIYENKGTDADLNDAFISYRRALELYADDYTKNYATGIPPALVGDVLRTASRLGFREEEEEIRKKYAPDSAPAQFGSTSGEVVLLHYSGLAPQKVDFVSQVGAGCGAAILQQQEVPDSDRSTVKSALSVLTLIAGAGAAAVALSKGCSPVLVAAAVQSDSDEETSKGLRALGAVATGGNSITLAIPDFRRRPAPIRGSEVLVEGAETVAIKSDRVENIEAIAIQSLRDRMGREVGKAVARAAVKFALAQGSAYAVKKQTGNPLLSLLVKSAVAAAGAATEEADKRSWRTLPAEIRIARLPLPPGTYNLKVRLLGNSGQPVRTETIENVSVAEGRKTFVRVVTMEAKGVK